MSSSNPFPSLLDVDGYQRISGTCSDSDEIKVVNGGLVRTVRLVNVSTNGANALEFHLTYDAQSPLTAGAVGAFWFHSYQMSLVGMGTSVVTATLENGIQYHFNQLGSTQNYELDRSNSNFIKATLTQASPTRWLVNFYPNAGYFEFDQNGLLQRMVDAHGNALTMAYSGAQLTSVTESTGGRAISFSYSSGLISGITDPNGNSFTLLYDGSTNLTNVVGPGGCVLTYGYATPANHLLTSRTDPNNNTYSYTYDGSARVTQVQDPDGKQLHYAYDTPLEEVADTGTLTQQIFRTILTDARGQVWQYHFDTGGNLWRTIDPQGHWQRFYWSPEQNLLYTCEGSPQIDPIVGGTVGGPRDNVYNSFTRNVFDPLGNRLYTVGPTGRMDRFEYDNSNRLISSFPGQAHIGVQGNWYGPFGQDGYLLCAWNSDSTDVSNLPAYVSSITPSGVTKTNYNNPVVLLDPRAPLAPNPSTSSDVQRRGVGLWKNLGSPSSPGTFSATIAVNQAKSFNLSIYSHALDQSMVSPAVLGPYTTSTIPSGAYYFPLTYAEQFGCYLEYEVTDSQGTQTFVVYNNGPGVWASFPVVTTDEIPNVTVAVSAVFNPDGSGSGSLQAQISALTFEPYDSRLTRYSYSSSLYGQAVYGSDSYGSDGDLTLVQGPLGSQQAMTYNADGTLATSTDSLGNLTQFFYTDSAKNLTQIIDPSGALWQMTYDNNGNLLTSTNPNNHTTSMTYDSKNRLLTTTDALGNTTSLSYDPAGNLIKTVDPLDRATLFGYTSANRLASITDALLGLTQMLYDASGNLVGTMDQRNNFTAMSYDSAGRLIQITQADAQVVVLALDAMNRINAITTANGTQPNLNNINVTNGANLLRNADVETADPLVSSGLPAQFWTNSVGSNNRDNTHSHSGTYSLPVSLGASASQSWSQSSLPLAAGGTYLANVWAQKSADGNAATLSLSASVYSLQHTVNTLASTATTLDGSSSNWQQLSTPFQFSVPGDSMFTRFSTTQFSASWTNLSSNSTQGWLDDFSLTPLSTTYAYDLAGNLEERRGPDGSRTRLYRDRWARVVAWEDSLGQRTLAAYDSRSRLISLTDPLGNQTAFGYDPNDNLVSLTNALASPIGLYGSGIYGVNSYVSSSQETQFRYNSRNLLSAILYQDSTSEQFDYDGAGNLTSYRDNQGRLRIFSYDQDERLTTITYSDATTVVLTYDGVGNVLSRLERNFDLNSFTYDALNRMVAESHGLGGASGVAWTHGQNFDAASNRTDFSYHASEYGAAIYGSDVYGTGPATWRVLDAAYGTARFGADLYQAGYDAMNRMPGYLDAVANSVHFSYDCEGRRTQIAYPFASVTTTAGYDISGRLLSQATQSGVSSLLNLSYGYDQNSNRIGMVAGGDGWDYELDASNRLIGANLNIWVDQLPAHFALGSCSATCLRPGGPGVMLLGYNDSFSGSLMNNDRWRVTFKNWSAANLDVVGAEIRQKSGLLVAYPRGFADTGVAASEQGWADPYGLSAGNYAMAVEHRLLVSGDFDIQVDFSDHQGVVLPGFGGFVQMGLVARDSPMDQGPSNQLFVARQVDSSSTYLGQINFGGAGTVATTDTSGKLRMQRVGSTATLSYDNGGSWSTLTSGSFSTGPMHVGLYMGNLRAVGSLRWANFAVTTPNQYPSSGTFVSSVYDSGQAAPTWGALSWSATLPGGTAVQFQLASSNSANGPWTYLGPTGAASFYTTPGTSIPSVGAGAQTGRYMRYQATLTGPGTATPELTQVSVTFAGTNPSKSYSYGFDPRGNMTGVTTQVAAGTATEVRTFNDLNQLLTNAVTPVGGGTTNWTYTWNLDGTLASKFDGTNTYAYTWDPGGDQRLLSMSLNGVTQVAFTYDSLGRMLTRTPYTAGVAGTPTNFEWDHWDCVREFAPAGTYRYYAPQGELITFDYTPTAGATSTYCLHSDALGSVRMITDSTGASVAHYEYDAWGNLLASSSDISFGFNYRYVGAWGVRYDATLGMYYCRQRWYDPSSQRFISRDMVGTGKQLFQTPDVSDERACSNGIATEREIHSKIRRLTSHKLTERNGRDMGATPVQNLYVYCSNNPTLMADPQGLSGLTLPMPPTAVPCAAKLVVCLNNCKKEAVIEAFGAFIIGPEELCGVAQLEVLCEEHCETCSLLCISAGDFCATWWDPAWPTLPRIYRTGL